MRNTRRRVPGTTITALLTIEHLDVRCLLDRIEDEGAGSPRQALLTEVGRVLGVHEVAEERLLFPAVLGVRSARGADALARAVQEHRAAHEALGQLWAAGRSFLRDPDRISAFVVRLRAHLRAEETGLFRLARRVVPARQLLDLGAQLLSLRASRAPGEPIRPGRSRGR